MELHSISCGDGEERGSRQELSYGVDVLEKKNFDIPRERVIFRVSRDF